MILKFMFPEGIHPINTFWEVMTLKELSFYYMLRIRFSGPVTNHRFTVRCVPRDNERQKIRQLEISVLPKESLSNSLDSFGNYCIYGHCQSEHELFKVEVKGTAQTGIADSEYAGMDYLMGRYRYQTNYTRPGKALVDFYRQFVFAEGTSNLEKGMRMMEALYRAFRYEKGVTSISTTAEEALELGRGVCQDYSHILISLCRMAGIPARYVVGMLIGEGASHAWVEVYDNGRWYALDPTNMLVVNEDHIKISSGRDYNDCVMNQGIMVGTAKQSQEVEVLVEEIMREDE